MIGEIRFSSRVMATKKVPMVICPTATIFPQATVIQSITRKESSMEMAEKRDVCRSVF